MNWIAVTEDLPPDNEIVEVLCWGAFTFGMDPMRIEGALAIANAQFDSARGWWVPHLKDWRSVRYWRKIEHEYPNDEVRKGLGGDR